MCEIWKVEEDDYIHNCTKREGPVFPDLTADNKMPSSCASKNCSVSKKLSVKIEIDFTHTFIMFRPTSKDTACSRAT